MTLPEAIADGLQILVRNAPEAPEVIDVAMLEIAIAFLRDLRKDDPTANQVEAAPLIDPDVIAYVRGQLDGATRQREATDAKRADNEAFYRGELDAIHRAAVLVLVDDFETTLRECSLKQALERLRNRIRHVPPVRMNVDPKDTRPVVECVPRAELLARIDDVGTRRNAAPVSNESWLSGWNTAIAAVRLAASTMTGIRLA